ncbi:MAG: TetR/AcrR family transcriptional regulator [Salinisphaeraceae bacterium]|nr:TetR/AcrR family transcriptional regulator [Salinisphaeraceae bacterium]
MSTKRQPDLTRQRLLESAFNEIHRFGFRSASLESILKDTHVTKGALYHHFRNKTDLGYAVVDEVLKPWVETRWRPIFESDKPIDAALAVLHERLAEMSDEEIALGCPLNNLCQEMSGLDEGFQQRLNSILNAWRNGIAEAMRNGQNNGNVRQDIDPDACAAFVVGSIEGCMGMAKASQDAAMLRLAMLGLAQFLEAMRPCQESKGASNGHTNNKTTH